MIRTADELRSRIAEARKMVEEKHSGSNGKRSIVLCGGTGCLSSNSLEIKNKFEELIKENELEEKISVNIAGCFGFCSQGPFVKIYPEDTLYRLVKESDVKEIFEKDILNNEVVERLLYVDPETKEKVIKQHSIKFYEKQKRISIQTVTIWD